MLKRHRAATKIVSQRKQGKLHLKRGPGPVSGLGRGRIRRKKKNGFSVILGFHPESKGRPVGRTLNPKLLVARANVRPTGFQDSGAFRL